MKCSVCHHGCDLSEGHYGFCHARTVKDGVIISENYGEVTALAFDPIEKKPLNRFLPGSMILSVSLWGCNMRCPWCQNDSISRGRAPYRHMTPEQVCGKAVELAGSGNIGLAFTYNEPLICPEFILDTAKLIKKAGMKNVLVTNGMVSDDMLTELLPFIDAMNIDLKSFSEENYRKIGGDLETVKNTIKRSTECCHVEVTTLIVPGFNDSKKEVLDIAGFIAKIDRTIPLHITAFYPAADMRNVPPTPIDQVYDLAEMAGYLLDDVFVGNC